MKNNQSWESGFISRLEKLAGDNPAAFAKKAGIKDQTFRKYLQGSIPRSDKLLQIAETAKVSADWLLTGEEPERLPLQQAMTFTEQALRKYPFLHDVVTRANKESRDGLPELTLAEMMINMLKVECVKLKFFSERKSDKSTE